MIASFTIITLVLIALCCYLAVRFHAADKAVASMSKIAAHNRELTLESLSEALKAKGYTVDGTDDKEQSLSFSTKDLRYNIDLGRRPLVFLHTGFGTDEDMDMECIGKAMAKATDEIVMVKGNVYEDGYSFVITSCEQSLGHFTDSLDKYMDILDDAIRRFSQNYHEFLGEKRGREQAIAEVSGLTAPEDNTDRRDNKILS